MSALNPVLISHVVTITTIVAHNDRTNLFETTISCRMSLHADSAE